MRRLAPAALLLGLAAMPAAARAEQFVLFDVTFTYTKADADNARPSKSHFYVKGDLINKDRPRDWTAPVDYRNGTAHVRLEVLEKPPGGAPTTWTICYIPNKGRSNGYGCMGTGVYREAGIYERDVAMTEFWENRSIVWEEGIKQMDLVIKDDSGGQGHAHRRKDPERYFPTKVRITVVQVSAGSKYDPKQVPAPASRDAPAGVARIREDARALAPLASTDLARAFLKAADSLPAVAPRTLHFDQASKSYLTDREAGLRADRAGLKVVPVDESFFYNTRYGSPLAYARPMEILGRAGLADLAGRKVADLGCGGIGPIRLMAAMGADALGIDVDPTLAALYGRDDLGRLGKGNVDIAIGRYPQDEAIRARVSGLDVFLSKNTLKRGYVHPDRGKAFIDLGPDAAFLEGLRAAIKPGGYALIYNLGPAPGKDYLPMADIRCPFPREAWERAGFRVEAIDADDSEAARKMGVTLGWGDAAAMEKNIFASYTLARRP
ncbi:hypothetical protein OJF2_35790 [Aquisphaera giovannonii]|uniref:Methyltransferase type 11 domain-containing protein n=1 Tax=Aquisphaera giovannonii TaxID=406548 RepID=A0A5B9W451_9BACT|nr:hypothetical protein [Aquisphaera giovannonii]QEH35034.1 hypothetical protein OJF2_35790 [Aquisphaera giovannonii]